MTNASRGYYSQMKWNTPLSVEHAQAVQGYRAAHEVALRRSRGEATTEDMRQAMIGYRRLLDDLLDAANDHDHLRAAS